MLCVYLPFECPVNEETYLEKLGVLPAILSELDASCVSMLAGWNADIGDVHSMCATHLKDCCSDTSMVISDEDMFAGDSFTQLTERCMSSSYGHNLITAMHVQYGTSFRDHIPLIVDIIKKLYQYLKTLLIIPPSG